MNVPSKLKYSVNNERLKCAREHVETRLGLLEGTKINKARFNWPNFV